MTLRAMTSFAMLMLATAVPPKIAPAGSLDRTAHDFGFTAITGEPMPMSDFAGKAVLLVNTASKCGFTPQYEGLQALYETYGERGFVVLGVPSNDFGNQEPGGAEEIDEFCEVNFGVTFPMTQKNHVVGAEAHPLYTWLVDAMGPAAKPRWNFHKVLIDPDGVPRDAWPSTVKPRSDRVETALKAALPARAGG